MKNATAFLRSKKRQKHIDWFYTKVLILYGTSIFYGTRFSFEVSLLIVIKKAYADTLRKFLVQLGYEQVKGNRLDMPERLLTDNGPLILSFCEQLLNAGIY